MLEADTTGGMVCSEVPQGPLEWEAWNPHVQDFLESRGGKQGWVHRSRDTLILKDWVRNFVREGCRAQGDR